MTRTITLIFLLFSLLPAIAQDSELQHAVAEAKKKQQFDPVDVARAEQMIRNAKPDKIVMDAYVLLANTYVALEQYDTAYDYYLKAIGLSNRFKLHKKAAYINGRLGSVQVHLLNYESSLGYFRKALAYYEKNGEKQGMIAEKANIAIVQMNLGQIDEAIATLESTIGEKDITDEIRATAYFAMGNIYVMKRPDPAKAIGYYLKALALAGHNDNRFKVLILQNLAESYITLEQYDKAFHYNSLSGPIVEKIDSNELRATLYLFYSQIAEAQSRYSEAFEYLKLHKKYQDLADLSQMRAKIDNLEALNKIKQQQYDLQIKQQKIKILEQGKMIDQIRKTALLLLLAILLVLIFLIVKRYRRRVTALGHQIVQTTDRLEFSQAKIDKMVLGIIRDNKFTEHLRQDMKAIQDKITDPDAKKQFGGLIAELQNFRQIRENKEELFAQVHKDFLYGLDKKITGLTEEEQQVCILIYLNLKNKDIALLLNLSVRSVENTRYRIRKKAGIATTDSLSEYIKTI